MRALFSVTARHCPPRRFSNQSRCLLFELAAVSEKCAPSALTRDSFAAHARTCTHRTTIIQRIKQLPVSTVIAHFTTAAQDTTQSTMPLEAAEKKLAELGYQFNDALQMRQLANDEPFEFSTQAHYEELADAVAEYIQELMVAKYGMRRVILPLSRGPRGARFLERDEEDDGTGVPIFVSENVREAKAVLVLVCGSGAVMAGQWARKLCMNDSLHEGSVIPLLVWAAQRGIGIVILNPNFRPGGGARMSAEGHVVQAWDQVIENLPAAHLAMVAHSYGGVCACRLLSVREEELLPRLRCIAFTDSVHGTWGPDILSSASKRFFVSHCVNWVQSEAPLGTVVEQPFLPIEDRLPELGAEPEAAVEIVVKVGQEAETEPGKEAETETEPTVVNVYDEELGVLTEGQRKGKEKETGETEEKERGVGTNGNAGGAAIFVPAHSEEREVAPADISDAAAGLGFSEVEAVVVTTDKDDVSAGKYDVGTVGADVSTKEEAGLPGASDETGQKLNMSDKAALVLAAARETDPGLRKTLLRFAGEPDTGDVSAGPSSSRADVSRPRVGVGGRIRGVSSGGRVGSGGRSARKAQKTEFSWANLGGNKEYCRCLELSAGVDEHERTTYSALESVKKFLEEKLRAAGAELGSRGEVAPENGAEIADEA